MVALRMKQNARWLSLVFMLVAGTLATIIAMDFFGPEGWSAGSFDPQAQNSQSVTETGNQQEPDSTRPVEDDRYDVDHYWPQWRGPQGTGVAPHADPLIEWSDTRNIRWKIALPGQGHSTPIIWGDRIFLTTTIPFGDAVAPKPETAPGAHDNAPVTHHQKFVVLAVSRADGTILWQRTMREELPHERRHNSAGFASASPVTDGEHLFAYFGSRGLYCLDLNGELQWETDLGDMQSKHEHGEGASPALYGETLVVNWDHEGQSFVVAFDKRTGEERWNVQRDEITSWATPIVVVHEGRPQVVISGSQRLRGYDLATGEVIWECGGLSRNVVASPVASDGMVYAGSSYEKKAMLAIRLEGAKGDISRTDNLVWMRRRGTPYVPSPLLYGEALYFLHHYQGIMSRVIAKTGEEPFGPFRLNGIGNVYASPVGAADRVYITDLDGTTLVMRHGVQPEVLALNQLDDSFSASAAIVDGELYLRGRRFLYCIAQE